MHCYYRNTDEENRVIKTVYNKVSNAGQNTTVWDGKDSLNVVVTDGIYKYKITAVDTIGQNATVTKISNL
jgi:flagellar hook assembly protein FlgD